MQYETISASTKHSVTLTLSRPMADFLFNVIANEIADEPIYQIYDVKKLRRIGNLLWEYLGPTSEQKKSAMERWVKSLNLRGVDTLASINQKNRSEGLL